MADRLRISGGHQYGHTNERASGGGLEVRLSAYELLSAIVYDDDNDAPTPPAGHPHQSLRSPAVPHFDLPEPHVDAKRHLLDDLLVRPKSIVRKTTQARRKIPEIYDRVVKRLFPHRRANARAPEVSEVSTLESEFYIIHVDHDCVICRDTIRGPQICTPCGHYFDRECLINLVEASTRDESLFPPRCCQQHIPQSIFQPYMNPALSTLYSEKSEEFSTLRRVYCANPSCSRFLGSRAKSIIPRSLPCPSCSTTTCNRCRAKVTKGIKHKCAHTQSHREVLSLASREGWSRCPKCEQVIELRSGCYHMTCICSAQFCYLCGAPWKTCECSQWEHLPHYDFAPLELPNVLGPHRPFTRRRRAPTPPPPQPSPEPSIEEYPRPPSPIIIRPSSVIYRTMHSQIHDSSPSVEEYPRPSSPIIRPSSVVYQTRHSRIHDRPLPRPPKEPPQTLETLWECGAETPHEAFILARGVQAQLRRQEHKRTLGRPRRRFGVFIERGSIVSLDPLPPQSSGSP